MKRLLTLLAMLVMGTVAVRTQQPANEWQAMTHEAKVTFADGVKAGVHMAIHLRHCADCDRPVPDLPNSAVVNGLDKLYSSSRSNMNIADAVTYVYMELGGATEEELNRFLFEINPKAPTLSPNIRVR